uniref:DUF6824 domain-containing protein n=1 Tax=Leptocylindrus danicus TaxID=163516 RepID=A0A7S2KBQ9_9STRA|mmetsp:Transcript_20973/g.31290  ORF Transcript_20973/g.31290 Transcript_20973/m.31290 type:complete len:367 (+) Transcript_20973:131-1231(+)
MDPPPIPPQQPETVTATVAATYVSENNPPPPQPASSEQTPVAVAVAVAVASEASSSNNTADTTTPPATTSTGVPLVNIKDPGENDVLCGRGGGTNNHIGNERFRILVQTKKKLYLQSSKRDKPLVSREIVALVRGQNPPGRFLGKDVRTGLWFDIGDQKAREKTSQALREGAPNLRQELDGAGMMTDGGMMQHSAKGRSKMRLSQGGAVVGSMNQLQESLLLQHRPAGAKRSASTNSPHVIQQHHAQQPAMMHTGASSSFMESIKPQQELRQPTYEQDFENRMLLTEFSAPAMMATWSPAQQRDIDMMCIEADHYFEAGLTGISVDEYFQGQEQSVLMQEDKKHVHMRVDDALCAMGEGRLVGTNI